MQLLKASGKSLEPGGQEIAFDIFLRWERTGGRGERERQRWGPPATEPREWDSVSFLEEELGGGKSGLSDFLHAGCLPLA